MKKLYIILLFILAVPLTAHGAFGVPLIGTSTTGWLFPSPVNGTYLPLSVSNLIASSTTATSSFVGPFVIGNVPSAPNLRINTSGHMDIGRPNVKNPGVAQTYPSINILCGAGAFTGSDCINVGNTVDGWIEMEVGAIGTELGLVTGNDEQLATKTSYPSGDYIYGNGLLRATYGTGSGDGKVGIGTSSPWSTLSVSGTTVFASGTTTFDGGNIAAATSSALSGREAFGIPEPISSNGWLAQRIDTQVALTYLHPMVLGCAGDGFSYLLCGNNNAMLTALKGILNFAGYEGGWANKIAGGAAVVSGDFATWISGVYSTLPSGGSLTFSLDTSADTPVFSDTIKIYYIKESGAGVFKVQTSLDDSSWSDLAAPCNSINAVNATQVGAVANCMTTLQTQYMRIVGVSGGTTKVVGDAIFASTSPTTREGFVMIGQGIFSKDAGVSYENLTSAPSAVTAPIIASIKPDLLVNFHAGSSSPSGIENFYNEFNNAYASTSWVFVGHPSTVLPTSWTYDDDIKRREAAKLGIPYIDLASQWGTQDQATSSGMLGPDLVHPTAGGFDWIASKVISSTPVLQFGHGQMSAATQFREVDSVIGGGIYQYNPSYTTTYHINGPGPRAISTGDPGSGGGYELLDYNANPTWDGWFLQVRNGLSFVSGCFANAFIQNCKFGYMDTPQNVATMNINSYGGTNVPLWVQQPSGATGDQADFTVQSYPAGSIGGIVAKIAVDGSITSQGATSTFSGSVRIGTTTNNSALEINGSSHIEEQSLATSTSMTIDFSAKAVSNILTMNVGTANIAVTFTNASRVPGKTLIINVSAPATGVIGSTTFSGGSGSGSLLWDGGISPGNSIVNGSMDVFCFTSTNGTSTPIIKADLCGSF